MLGKSKNSQPDLKHLPNQLIEQANCSVLGYHHCEIQKVIAL
jgi:hypothetical protein